MALREVDVKTLTPSVFSVFGRENALLTAGSAGESNTMTIGWCGLGEIWGLPSCTVYVRPERHTYGFMEREEYFSVSVPPMELHERIRPFGVQSGRDTDKYAASGLAACWTESGVPYVDGCGLVLVCRKMYAQDMSGEHVLDHTSVDRYYRSGGWHRMYIGEVVEAYLEERDA